MKNSIENKYLIRARKARVLHKQIERLSIAQQKLGYVRLEKPVRHGWFKHLVLRQDIANREDAAVFQEIVKIAAKWIWGRDKPHVNKEWERAAENNKLFQFPGFKFIEKDRYKLLSGKAKKYFKEYELYWSPWLGSVKAYYCLVPSYYFVPGYTKAYLTHRKVIDGELERRIAELEVQLNQRELYPYSLYAGGYPGKWARVNYHRKQRRRIKMALVHFEEETLERKMRKHLPLW
ncbi:hypothetical protein AAG747_22615 [Rapidithrix thailandica]|uniref:Uncharacterized protein n=1 Tax=Rapidithrix thailandica TaxID=413964 RepID=A0AAW9SJ64_9BACT